MKIKNLVFVTLLFLFVSCERNSIKTLKYHSGGQPKMKCELKDNLKNGKCLEYSISGDLIAETYWVNDSLNGPMKVFYPDGTVKQLAKWRNGKLQDSCRIFHENGSLKKLLIFDNGKKTGNHFLYDDEGNNLSIQKWITAQGITFKNSETKFSIQGDTLYSSHFVEIKPELTHLNSGEDYQLEITLRHPIYDKMEVYAGSFNSDFTEYVGEVDTLKPKGFQIFRDLKVPESLEKFQLTMIFKDYEETRNEKGGTNTTYQLYYLTKEYDIVSD